MYLTAASAAWRYSGNVTGPLSILSKPRTIGAPDAFLGVPRASAAGAAAVDDEVDFAVELVDLSSLPQPAATTAMRRANTMTSGRRSDFTVASFLVIRRLRRRGNW